MSRVGRQVRAQRLRQFDSDRGGHLLVSDAALSTGMSGATSYDVTANGTVTASGPACP